MTDSRPAFVVGIGASAGGLESLERFFRQVPMDTGMAFLVVQHLSPEHKSLMEELLGRFTGLPIETARDGVEIEANHIYLLPPGKEIEVEGHRLRVFPRNTEAALAFPIDRLLQSLARAWGAGALAVILSGSGSDGARGVRAIDAASGLVFVEDPTRAAFDGMPRSAIETGVAAAVLSAESLAHALVDQVSGGESPDRSETEAIRDVVHLLHDRLGASFHEYKHGTIFRRLQRRARLKDSLPIAAYVQMLEDDEQELRCFHDDLLVNVTSFFRDPHSFEVLNTEIDTCARDLVEPKRELRAWVAGCATGEEAYSIAILFDEAIRRAGMKRTFKVFATDIHASALDAASAGVFPPQVVEALGEQRVRDYFTRRSDGSYQVVPAIRQRVVFANHNLLTDTPFTNLDVVSCRNLLIYLKPPAQARALSSLSYGLRVGGTLFLGSSESLADMAPHFEVVRERGKIFRKRVHARSMHRPELSTRMPTRSAWPEPRQQEARLLPLYDALLDRFMPPAFLVSEQRRLVDSYGGAETYLQVGRRRPSTDFLDLLPTEVRLSVGGVLARAQKDAGSPQWHALQWPRGDGEPRPVRIRAERLVMRNAEPAYILSLSECVPSPAAAPVVEAGRHDETRVVRLEDELANTRISLQATVEELEASNEELQATNEELVASNEELQSVNEELHSVNEELHTVNAEHQMKIAELTELNRDIGHLLESIDVATVYLDKSIKIRKYTPKATSIFGLVEHDIGRYLSSFNHNLCYPGFIGDVEAVRDGGGRVEKEIRSNDGDTTYFVRLLPYLINGSIEGVVVTMTDASALAAAKERAQTLSAIVESTGDAVIGQTLQGVIVSWNAAATRMYGYTAAEAIGQSIMMLVPPDEQDAMRVLLGRIAAGADAINVAARRIGKSGAILDIAKTMSPVRDEQGTVMGIASIDRDVREQKNMERRLRVSEAKYEDLYQNAPDLYLTVDASTGRIGACNRTSAQIMGVEAPEVEAMYWADIFAEASRDVARRCLTRIRDGQELRNQLLQLQRNGDGPLDVTLSATLVHDENGAVLGARTVLRDISDLRRAEAKLSEATRLREQFLAMVSHELRSPLQAVNAAFHVIDAPAAGEVDRERSERVVRRQLRQITRLVDDLLDVSRITQGVLKLERAPLDLAEILRGAVDAVVPAFHTKGVRLLMEGLEARLPMFGDGGRLGQVFANLLNNALRHTPRGRQVRVGATRRGAECRIEIADEGQGIAADDLRSIFDMFTQSNQGLARTEGGLGLGLTIAQRIVTAHGGDLAAISGGIGKGATFTVRLELDDRAESVVESTPHSEKLSILLVEDQQDARDTMKVLLGLAGHDVLVAASAEDAITLLEERLPQVGLFDIGLPCMNGYELAREVRNRWGRSVRLIAMSGYGQPEDVAAAEEAGFERHLTKPVDPGRLEAALREFGIR